MGTALDLAFAKSFLTALGLTMPRMLAVFLLVPLFNRQLLPGMLRGAVAASLCLVLVPAMQGELSQHRFAGLDLLALILKEATIGFMLGFLIALPFWSLEAVGFIVDNQRGASIASSINPLTGHDSSPLGMLFNQAFMVFFLLSGGFVLMLSVLYQSYELWPVLGEWPTLRPSQAPALLGLLDRLVGLAMVLAGPVLVAMFLAEMGLALVSRFAPQLQVFFLAMPIKSALAMLMLAVYAVNLFDNAALEINRFHGLFDTVRDTLGWKIAP
ncbi:type III secretion system export apparatus subunit SctT [Chitinimonas lacunae]|uniref:Type III secretion system export apparatus subunit SctT n=1 Tax=Chitinimonas lacunae TaxID=1963018 RepID=A0ABV8MRT7_9NEIS